MLIITCFFLLVYNPCKEFESPETLTTIFLITATTGYFAIKDMIFKSRMLKYFMSPYKLYSMIILLGGFPMIILSIIFAMIYGLSREILEAVISGAFQSIATYCMLYSLTRENKGFTPMIVST